MDTKQVLKILKSDVINDSEDSLDWLVDDGVEVIERYLQITSPEMVTITKQEYTGLLKMADCLNSLEHNDYEFEQLENVEESHV